MNNTVVQSKIGPIIVNRNDMYVSRSIIEHGIWSEPDLWLTNQILQELSLRNENLVYYDVGANLGVHSIYVSKFFGERIRIRAFEAQLAVFQMLCGSIALNGLRNIRPHFNAVSEREGETLNLRLPDYARENNFAGLELVPAARSDNGTMTWSDEIQPVTTIALDSFDEPVHFVKMDIEGMEVSALRGARSMLERRRPVVFCELVKSDESEIFSFFKPLAYRAYRFAGDGLFTPYALDLARGWTDRIF